MDLNGLNWLESYRWSPKIQMPFHQSPRFSHGFSDIFPTCPCHHRLVHLPKHLAHQAARGVHEHLLHEFGAFLQIQAAVLGQRCHRCHGAMTGLDRDETPMFGWVFCWEFGLKPEKWEDCKNSKHIWAKIHTFDGYLENLGVLKN